MIMQFFCRHKYKSIRKGENNVLKTAKPETPTNGMIFYTHIPVEFYTVKETTEVFICEKCGHDKIIRY
jgi:hypothetical protein